MKKLSDRNKEAILFEAFQGKLVEQIESEGTGGPIGDGGSRTLLVQTEILCEIQYLPIIFNNLVIVSLHLDIP